MGAPSPSRHLAPAASGPALSDAIPGWQALRRPEVPTLGVLAGEGVGEEVMGAALEVLEAVADGAGRRFDVRRGGAIGLTAKAVAGQELTPDVVSFCDEVFRAGGALLCGPGGGRFVYDLREKFHLFCKLVPLRPLPMLRGAGPLRPEAVSGADILVVRENVGGVYLGEAGERREGARLGEAHHRFRYDALQVDRIVRVAMELARRRRGRVGVVVKRHGVPSISELWIESAEAANAEFGLALELLEVDNACFQIVADATHFDVIVAPNLFGDVVADTGALLLGSRGLAYSANFGEAGRAAYQTAHGAALELARTDRANPVGQIQALAMLLEESFGMGDLHRAIERAIGRVLSEGWRTADVMQPGCRMVGTCELGRRIAEQARWNLHHAA
jgi:3-isopropylmalate dehydrogenase